tara:strand:- start:389 stop:1225 length:837 start_codon:yes stop_codon:yes gene_type:complete
MAWIKSDQSLAEHPKLKLLAKDLGISEVEALGHLHLLWYWTLEYAEDGHVKYIELLPEAMKWTGDTDKLVNALIKRGFLDQEIDGTYWVHDWLDYSGAYYEKKLYNRIKKQESRDKIAKLKESDTSLTSFDNSLTNIDSQDLDKNREEKNRVDKNNSGLATQDGVSNNSNRDLIFETLATVCGYDWKGVMTKDERGRINKAVKQLKDINATPEEITLRAQNFVLSYGFNPQPQSITSMWTKLVKVQPKLTKKQTESIRQQAVNEGRWEDLEKQYGEDN